MELHDMTLTINDGLDGMGKSVFSIFLLPLCACFESLLTGLRLPLLPPTRDSRKAF
jgi:hypothetical protein